MGFIKKVCIFLVILLVYVGLVSFLGSRSAVFAGTVIAFADPNLEDCVRKALGLRLNEPITVETAQTLTDLWCNDMGITDLSGLEYFSGLKWLGLWNNQISDISPLTNLDNLLELGLARNQINDISPLANLTNLRLIYLAENQINDISPLTNLTNLEELYLYGNQISDISPLANLTNLRLIYLAGNQISDISPLANLDNLEELYLYENQISDIGPLANLSSLEWLVLDGNQISDISPLANLTNLRLLGLCDNPITDYSPIAGLNIRECYCCEGSGNETGGTPEGECSADNLVACTTEEACTGVGAYWYEGACHAEAAPPEEAEPVPTEHQENREAPVNTGGVSVGGDAVDGVLSMDEELKLEVRFPGYTKEVDVYVAVAVPDIGAFFVTAEGEGVFFDGNNFVPYAAGVTRVPILSSEPITIYHPIWGCMLLPGKYTVCSLIVPSGTDISTWFVENNPGELNCYSFTVECEVEN